MSAAALDEVEVGDEQARLAVESLERRQADLELRTDLALAGFRGPGWDRYAWELARYGYAVVMAWLTTGEMFNQCKAKGCSLGSPPLEWTVDDRAGLANETVALGVINFKQQALIEGKWTAERGATLKTYFIGACVFAFPNLYRKWSTERSALQCLTSIDCDAVDRSRPPRDPGEIAVNRFHVREGFNNIPDDRTKSAILLQEMGYTYAEIGEILRITPRAVDGLIRRQHKRGGGHHD
ncbi:MAG: RNA polymerase sigma factor [Pseudonocardiaceae bacterium]